MRRDGSSFKWHQPCQRCKYTTSVDIQKCAIKSWSLMQNHMRAQRVCSRAENSAILKQSSSSSTERPSLPKGPCSIPSHTPTQFSHLNSLTCTDTILTPPFSSMYRHNSHTSILFHAPTQFSHLNSLTCTDTILTPPFSSMHRHNSHTSIP